MPPHLQPGAQQMAAQGQNGDSLVAHMTPGEIAIPPQIQTPQLMAAIRQAFAQAGVNPAQFTAGSPAASHNPATGAPQFNLLSTLLPMAAAGGAAFLAPEIIPAIAPEFAAAMGSALAPTAAGLASAGATAATGGNATQSLMSGVGAAGGQAIGGSLLGSASPVAPTAATPTAPVGGNPFGAVPSPEIGAAAQGATSQVANPSNVLPANPGQLGFAGQLKAALPAAIGAGIGQSLAPAQQGSNLPPGFNNKLGPVNPQFGQLLGSNQANRPTFTGYNPYSSVTGPNAGYNFFPQGG